ncbi:hypothetical protein L6303_00715 [archaeon]|nr:hypothetical protein [Nanoarchaeota archaeon]MBU4300900.1 hypothetical protein [Nanoarchaeota archaeon]MBU4451184.1 hypothetical protein [Nanoarchaeota archaeon]MCG2723247.1 hypothetical protein [archaeon]
MNGGAHYVLVILVILGALLFLKYNTDITISAEKDNVSELITADISDNWNSYSNNEVGITFRYPKTWEITQDYFYTTAAGSRAKRPTIILQKIGDNQSNNWILINPRQFMCENGMCVGSKNTADEVATHSKNKDILDLLNTIVSELKQNTTRNKVYSDKEGHLTFEYPQYWEIIESQHRRTADGRISISNEVTLQKIGNNEINNLIFINPNPQFRCELGTCILSADSYNDGVATYSKNKEVLNMLGNIASELKAKNTKNYTGQFYRDLEYNIELIFPDGWYLSKHQWLSKTLPNPCSLSFLDVDFNSTTCSTFTYWENDECKITISSISAEDYNNFVNKEYLNEVILGKEKAYMRDGAFGAGPFYAINASNRYFIIYGEWPFKSAHYTTNPENPPVPTCPYDFDGFKPFEFRFID